MLEFLDHPHKSLRPHTNIILVKTTSLVNNGRLAASYLDNVYVRETPSLGSNVNQRFEQGGDVSRTTSTRARNSSPDMSQKGERSSKSAS